MKRLASTTLALTLALSVSACSILDSIAEKGAEANDESIKISLFALCQGASVGSIKRQFNTAELVKIYNELCKIPEQVGIPNPDP